MLLLWAELYFNDTTMMTPSLKIAFTTVNYCSIHISVEYDNNKASPVSFALVLINNSYYANTSPRRHIIYTQYISLNVDPQQKPQKQAKMGVRHWEILVVKAR